MCRHLSGITAQMPVVEESGITEEMPTAEMPLTSTTGETPTIEEQFRVLEETGELPAISDDEATRLASLDDTGEMPSIGDDEVTRLASLDDDEDDEDEIAPDSTAGISSVMPDSSATGICAVIPERCRHMYFSALVNGRYFSSRVGH